MITPKELFELINPIAPVETAMEGDPCGLLIDLGNATDGVLVALDVTPAVIEEAKRLHCGIIVTHHPVIYIPIKTVTPGCAAGQAVAAGISVISLHTCWDAAEGGINDILAKKLGLFNVRRFGQVGRMGELPKAATARELANTAISAFGARHASVVDCGNAINTVAIVGGGGGGEQYFLGSAGVDAFITGELLHHEMLYDREIGVSSVSLGHFETEAIAGAELAKKIAGAIGNRAKVSASNAESAPNYHITAE